MATTTNFGWETPDDTDLVKDGAAAIRTALNGVDTSFLDLKGGTTGQLLKKNSGTDLDFVWGSADSATLLSTTTLNSDSNVISSISQSYKHLRLYIADWYTSGTPTGGGISIRVNSNTTSPNYAYPQVYMDNAGTTTLTGSYGTQIALSPATPAYADNNNVAVIDFNFYTSTLQKSGSYVNNYKSASGVSPNLSIFGSFTINETSAISSITIRANSTITGTAYLYGVN